jgi:hypothetical protein
MAYRLRRRDLVKKVRMRPPNNRASRSRGAVTHRRRCILRGQVRSKCEATLWVGGSIWLLSYLDFVHVVLEGDKVDR